MQTNKWEAFLSDQELIDGKEYHRPLNGKYLFGKILHDVLECLNNYKAILSLIASSDVEISTNTLHWFTSKKGTIESAVTEITPLGRYHEEFPVMSNEWPNMIKLVGSKLSDIQTFADDFQEFDKLSQGVENDLVTMAIANLRGVQAIYTDIQAENYKQLWATGKYQKYDKS